MHELHAGEDVDYCMRLRRDTHAPLISVPAARVQHPFWPKPLQQIAGWASGDVRCLDTLPSRGFRAPPNWAELSMITVLFAGALPFMLSMLQGKVGVFRFEDSASIATIAKPWWAAVVVVVEVAMLCAVNLQRVCVATGVQPSQDAVHPRLGMNQVLVSFLAVVPPMLQV